MIQINLNQSDYLLICYSDQRIICHKKSQSLHVVLIKIILIYLVNGALWWTRTTDPRFRKQMLYPAELRVHIIILDVFIVLI